MSGATLAELLERAVGALKFLDINLRKECYDDRSVDFSLGQADILKLNEDEAHTLARMLEIRHGSLADFCATIVEEYGLRFCLVTLGDKGAVRPLRRRPQDLCPGIRGCRRGFAGLGRCLLGGVRAQDSARGWLEEAVAFGNVLGAIVATQTGATTPVAREEIDRFLGQNIERNIHPEFRGEWR